MAGFYSRSNFSTPDIPTSKYISQQISNIETSSDMNISPLYSSFISNSLSIIFIKALLKFIKFPEFLNENEIIFSDGLSLPSRIGLAETVD